MNSADVLMLPTGGGLRRRGGGRERGGRKVRKLDRDGRAVLRRDREGGGTGRRSRAFQRFAVARLDDGGGAGRSERHEENHEDRAEHSPALKERSRPCHFPSLPFAACAFAAASYALRSCSSSWAVCRSSWRTRRARAICSRFSPARSSSSRRSFSSASAICVVGATFSWSRTSR